MGLLIFALPGQESLARSLLKSLRGEEGRWNQRRFPDGEFYVRVESRVENQTVILVSSLNDPDGKIPPLFFLASTLRDLGAGKIILVAPYLAYLRQDARFREGEGITSRYFAQFLSTLLDGLVTVDPHLHRYASLSEIYSVPTRIAHAAPRISEWIRLNVPRALVIGPDQESAQWAEEVAHAAGCPSVVLEKIRKGDRDVEIRLPSLDTGENRIPVIVDDIISSARTMSETVRLLKAEGFPSPVCVGIHAIFAGKAYEELLVAGPAQVVTCDTIPHPSNQIELSSLVSAEIEKLLAD